MFSITDYIWITTTSTLNQYTLYGKPRDMIKKEFYIKRTFIKTAEIREKDLEGRHN